MPSLICTRMHHLAMPNDRCTDASSNSRQNVPVKARIITPIIALCLLHAEAWCGSLIVMSLMELEALEGNAKAVLPNSCSAQIEKNESWRNESGALSSLTAVVL